MFPSHYWGIGRYCRDLARISGATLAKDGEVIRAGFQQHIFRDPWR